MLVKIIFLSNIQIKSIIQILGAGGKNKHEQIVIFSYTSRMNYRFFTNSEKTWEAMYEAISHAENSIYLEMYIFEDTVERFHFFDLLKEKAEKGIRIKLILDAFGSMELSNNKLEELKKSGAEVLFQSYLFHRAHRKILIVDEFVAYIGGANVHKTAQLWNDLVVRVEWVLVRNIMKSFAKSYTEAGGKDPLIVDTKNKISLEKVKIFECCLYVDE